MHNLKMVFLVVLLAVIGCSDNDDNNKNIIKDLNGKWTLLTASGTIAGVTHEFTNGTIVWEFSANNTLTVINNNTNNNLQSGIASGIYNYSITENGTSENCTFKITINQNELGCIVVNDNQMNIDQNVPDGIGYHFEKVMAFTLN